MANVYYTHYYLSACTKHSQTPFVVNLEKRHPDTDSAPDPIRISGGGRPAIISYKNNGDYKIYPIQGSEMKLTLLSDDVFDGIDAIDEREWRVTVTLDGALHWRGFILPDDGQEPFSTKPFPISIRATDILGTLKDVPYTKIGEIKDKGVITKLQLLCKLLNRTELGLDIIIADNTFESLMTRTGSVQNCPWPQTLYSNARYFDPEGRPYSCYEILRSILEEKSCVLYQADGVWHIVNQEENNRGLTAIPYRRYTSEGVYISSGTITHYQQLGGNGKQAVIAASNKTMRNAKAHLSNIAYYQYGYAASVAALNGDFNDWPLPSLLPTGWTQRGGVRVSQFERMVNGIATGDYGMRLLNANNKESKMYVYNEEGVQIRANESVTVSFDIFIELNGEDPGFINSRRSKLWVILSTSDAYAWDGTQWLKYSTYPNQTKIEWGKGEWSISNDDFGYGKASEKKTVTINIPARDVDYKLTLGLGNVYRNDITGAPNNLMITSYDNVDIRPSVVDEVLKPPLGRYVQHTQDKPLSYVPEPIVILNGDDTNEQRTSWIRAMQGGIFFTGNYTSRWYRRGEVLPTPLLSVIAGNAMQLHSRPYKIFEVDVERSEIRPYTRVDLDLFDSHFVFLSGDFDILNESAKLVLAEQISGVAPVTELNAEDYGSLKNKNAGLSIGAIGGVTIGGNTGGGTGGGGGVSKPTNRFLEYFMVDINDKVIAKVTTNMLDSFDIYSKYDNLMFRVREIDDAPDFADIAYDMEEGTGVTYRELNLHFRRADGSVLDDVYFSDTGIVGIDSGETKPVSGEPVRAEITYYGGIDGVEAWAGPTVVTFEVLKNGVLYEKFTETYPTPPPIGSLAAINFVPIKGENWEVNAVAEPDAEMRTLTVTGIGTGQSIYVHQDGNIIYYLPNTAAGTNSYTFEVDPAGGNLSVQVNNGIGQPTIYSCVNGATCTNISAGGGQGKGSLLSINPIFVSIQLA